MKTILFVSGSFISNDDERIVNFIKAQLMLIMMALIREKYLRQRVILVLLDDAGDPLFREETKALVIETQKQVHL